MVQINLVADDYLRRTAITRPILTDEQQDLLDTTISEWQTACNISSRLGWDVSDTIGYNHVSSFATPSWRNRSRSYSRQYETRKTHLQDLAYDTVLEETRLGSQHAILATPE
jgi:putative transposase